MKEIIIAVRNKVLSFCYTNLLKPVFFMQDPEIVHDHATRMGVFLGSNPVTRTGTKILFSYGNPLLEQTVAGIHFKNPVGLAAGFDKDAELVRILPSIGFGFEEVGSITGEYCEGNPKPRLWRLPKAQSIIVYYGLKNKGAQILASKLRNLRTLREKEKSFQIPIGISAAKTNCPETIPLEAGIADYLKVLRSFHDIGDYYTINISCPNSCGGTDFADPKKLEQLFHAMEKEQLFYKPVFLKLSPDLSITELDAIIAVSLKYNLTGLITSNLIKEKKHAHLPESEKELWKKGGLSGKPVKPYALQHVRHIYKKTKGKLVVIGCGGIFTAEDAYEYICNGASLVQLITGMIFQGPQVVSEINLGIVRLLKKDGFSNIAEAVGSGIK